MSSHAFQQPRLRRRLGELAAMRLARIGRRGSTSSFFSPRCGTRDRDLVAGLDAERAGQQLLSSTGMRQQDLRRHGLSS
jgi:hypothetical protein